MCLELLEPLGILDLLIVDDEEIVVKLLKEPLDKHCRSVLVASSVEDGLGIFKETPIDVLIADINLNGKANGLYLAREVRKTSPKLPIIIISGVDLSKQDFKAMVDVHTYSFLKKPIDLDELFILLLNISKNLKKDDLLDLGNGVSLRLKDRVILKGYAVFELTEKEYDILMLLLGHEGEFVDYATFQEQIWGEQKMTMDSLRMHINGLRRKTYYELVKTYSKIGYKLTLRH